MIETEGFSSNLVWDSLGEVSRFSQGFNVRRSQTPCVSKCVQHVTTTIYHFRIHCLVGKKPPPCSLSEPGAQAAGGRGSTTFTTWITRGRGGRSSSIASQQPLNWRNGALLLPELDDLLSFHSIDAKINRCRRAIGNRPSYCQPNELSIWNFSPFSGRELPMDQTLQIQWL